MKTKIQTHPIYQLLRRQYFISELAECIATGFFTMCDMCDRGCDHQGSGLTCLHGVEDALTTQQGITDASFDEGFQNILAFLEDVTSETALARLQAEYPGNEVTWYELVIQLWKDVKGTEAGTV